MVWTRVWNRIRVSSCISAILWDFFMNENDNRLLLEMASTVYEGKVASAPHLVSKGSSPYHYMGHPLQSGRTQG